MLARTFAPELSDDPPPTCLFTYADIREWLERNPADAECGQARSSASCPLAAYLAAKYPVAYQVGGLHVASPYPSASLYLLPSWACTFVANVDLHNGPLTFRQARVCLDNAAADCDTSDACTL